MESLFLLVVMSLAAYRVTRLIVSDTFPPVQRLRETLVGPDDLKLVGTKLEWFGELITCNWCASFWVSGLVVGTTNLFTSVPLPVLMWWGVAGFAAFILYIEDTFYGWSNVNMKQAALADASMRELRRTP